VPSFALMIGGIPKLQYFFMGKNDKKPVELIPSRSIWAVETAMNRMA
jgi:hypothetical protein